MSKLCNGASECNNTTSDKDHLPDIGIVTFKHDILGKVKNLKNVADLRNTKFKVINWIITRFQNKKERDYLRGYTKKDQTVNIIKVIIIRNGKILKDGDNIQGKYKKFHYSPK